jgi:Predicted AAA-ATPase
VKIPYGVSNFATLRSEGYFYVDKTRFLPHIESADTGIRHAIFLRPRRMGKSLLLSMMEHYYDLGWADQFDALFEGLWIHEQPTPERGSYLVLTLDFSVVAADGGEAALRRTFLEAVRIPVQGLVLRHGDRVPALGWLRDRLDSYQDAESLIAAVLTIVRAAGHRLYVLIDEYDSFASALLSADQGDLYSQVVDRSGGFIRRFYRMLEAGTRSGAIGRIFITGVTPLLLEELASGLNIVSRVSDLHELNALVGFTRADVELAVRDLFAGGSGLAMDSSLADEEKLLSELEELCGGYRFAPGAAECVFHPEAVLECLGLVRNGFSFPRQWRDINAPIANGALRCLCDPSHTGAAKYREVLSAVHHPESGHPRALLAEGERHVRGRRRRIALSCRSPADSDRSPVRSPPAPAGAFSLSCRASLPVASSAWAALPSLAPPHGRTRAPIGPIRRDRRRSRRRPARRRASPSSAVP